MHSVTHRLFIAPTPSATPLPQVRGQLQALSEWVSERSAPMTAALSAASQELGGAVQALLADIVSEAMGDPDASMEVREGQGGSKGLWKGMCVTGLEVQEGMGAVAWGVKVPFSNVTATRCVIHAAIAAVLRHIVMHGP